jgi:integrase
MPFALPGFPNRNRTYLSTVIRFPNKSGEPLRESKLLERVLQPATERAGLGRVTWHQFRHIHLSLLNDLRIPVKIAQEQLGHASISTTLNIYTHVVDGSHRRAIERLEARLFPTGPKSSEVLQIHLGAQCCCPASPAGIW